MSGISVFSAYTPTGTSAPTPFPRGTTSCPSTRRITSRTGPSSPITVSLLVRCRPIIRLTPSASTRRQRRHSASSLARHTNVLAELFPPNTRRGHTKGNPHTHTCVCNPALGCFDTATLLLVIHDVERVLIFYFCRDALILMYNTFYHFRVNVKNLLR